MKMAGLSSRVPDFGWGATDGATLREALDEAKDLLRELSATTLREGRARRTTLPPCCLYHSEKEDLVYGPWIIRTGKRSSPGRPSWANTPTPHRGKLGPQVCGR